MTVDLTNPDMPPGRRGRAAARRRCTSSARSSSGRARATSGSASTNYGAGPVDVPTRPALRRRLRRHLRGARLARARGAGQRLEPPCRDGGAACCGYEGLDGVRRTAIAFSPRRRATGAGTRLRSSLRCRRSGSTSLDLDVGCEIGDAPARPRRLRAPRSGAARARAARSPGRRRAIVSSNETFNDWIDRSRRRPADDDRPRRRTDRTPMPASPGSARRSAATGSSPRSRCCGSSPTWRAACSRYLAADQADRRDAAPATPSRARSCTRCATARWRRSARSRSAATTAASTPRRCS